MSPRNIASLLLIMVSMTLMACGPKIDLTHAGFTSKSDMESADRIVIAESVGGKLDPAVLAPENGRFNHNGANYSMAEEGYYRWGKKLYEMGYRDIYHIKDLAPRAFKRKIMDIYEAALSAGFYDSRDGVAN